MQQLSDPQLQAWLATLLRLTVWLALLAAVFVPLERLFAVRKLPVLRKGLATDLGYYFLNGLLTALVLSAPMSLVVWATHRALPEGFLVAVAGLPLWARAALGLLVAEVGYYWAHRISHEVPFLWRFHSIHHSAEEVDFLVNTRAHPVDLIFGRLCALAPIYALGLGSTDALSGGTVPLLVSLFATTWGFFIHANIRWRLGPLEWLVSTPAFHHWHHVRSGPVNRNYSSTLPWLDRLFGTHYLPGSFPEEYGVSGEEVPEALVEQLAYPLFPPPAPKAPAAPLPDAPLALTPAHERHAEPATVSACDGR